MSSRTFCLSLAVAVLAAGREASAADSPARGQEAGAVSWLGSLVELPPKDENAIGRDLVIDGSGDAVRIRVVALVDGKPIEKRRQESLAAAVKKADADGNGKITGKEFGEAFKAEFERRLGGPVAPGSDREFFAHGYEADEEVPVERLESQLNLDFGPLVEVLVQPQPLVDRLELFAALDIDGDRFVTTAELTESERLFGRYDADGDGTLSQPELAPTEPLEPTPVRSGADFPQGRFPFYWQDPFVGAKPDAVVEVRLIGRAFGRPKVTVVEKAEGLAVSPEARKAAFDVAGIGLDLESAAARVTSEDVKRFYLLQLRQRDGDKNGYLSEGEFAGLGLPGLDFRSADADGDGMLYPAELSERLDALVARESSRVVVQATFERQPLFVKLDADGDDRLSRRELRDARAALASADADGDGRVGLAEFGGRYRLSFGVPNLLDGASPRMAAEFAATARPPARGDGGPEWFGAMDRNADGDLDRREFLGTAARFAEFDADADGLLSPEEAGRKDEAASPEAASPEERVSRNETAGGES